jgi:hypothetical protein
MTIRDWARKNKGRPKKIVDVGSVKYLNMQDFAEMSLITGATVVGWMKGFYTHFSATEHYDAGNNTLLAYVPRVFYSPEEYSRFIVVDMSTRKYGFVDEFPTNSRGGEHVIKVLRHKDYEIDDVGQLVLNSIEEMEKRRKNSESKS